MPLGRNVQIRNRIVQWGFGRNWKAHGMADAALARHRSGSTWRVRWRQEKVYIKLRLSVYKSRLRDRKLLKNQSSYQSFVKNCRSGKILDFLIDAVFLASPYASSFDAFECRYAVIAVQFGDEA